MSRNRSCRADEKRAHRERKRDLLLAAHPRRMAHETMRTLEPEWWPATAQLARRKTPPSSAEPTLVDLPTLAEDPDYAEMIHAYGRRELKAGWPRPFVQQEARILQALTCCAVNFDIAGRKAFWVDGQLAELLRETNLDVGGDVLQLPFPCCAFLFDDPTTTAIVDELAIETGHERAPVRMVTIYVYRSSPSGRELTFVICGDSFDGKWPVFAPRVLSLEGKRNIDELLESRAAWPTGGGAFRRETVLKLVRLAVNSILYATSHDALARVRRPPSKSQLGLRSSATLSGETVFHLPGRILIGDSVSAEHEPTSTGRTVEKRFWVRGHWRSANASWEDQRLRWIRPYLKGPEMTAIVERAYAMRATAASPADRPPEGRASASGR